MPTNQVPNSHPQIHKTAHELSGGDALTRNIELDNDQSFRGRDTGGTGQMLIRLNSVDVIQIGDSGQGVHLRPISQATFLAQISGTTYEIWNDSIAQRIRKAADEIVNNSATLQDDDDLLFAVGANETWLVTLHVMFTGDNAADIKFGWSIPVSAVADSYVVRVAAGASVVTIADDGGDQPASVDNQGGNQVSLVIHAVIRTAGTAGNVVLQWAQQVATVADTTVKANSSLVAIRTDP